MIMIEQEENEKGSHFFPMHPNFKLIATQNPNNNSFLSKREELPEKLMHHFNVINFPSLTESELEEIVEEIAKKNEYNDKGVIKGIKYIHSTWIYSRKSKTSPQCFTIRDINNVIKSISEEKEFPYDSLMCFYGMRFHKKEREKFQNFIETFYEEKKFKELFENEEFSSLIETFKKKKKFN